MLFALLRSLLCGVIRDGNPWPLSGWKGTRQLLNISQNILKYTVGIRVRISGTLIVTVREHEGWVRNVALIKCTLSPGKPKRGWNLEGRVQKPDGERGELVYKQPGTEVDDSCHS